MDESGPAPAAGMTISVRTRRDVVVVDPERFLTAARRAYEEATPGADATNEIADVYDAVFALLERDGQLAPDALTPPTVGRGAPLPGVRVTDRPDGMSPAGMIQEVVLSDPRPLQDYGCFLPPDPYALPGAEA